MGGLKNWHLLSEEEKNEVRADTNERKKQIYLSNKEAGLVTLSAQISPDTQANLQRIKKFLNAEVVAEGEGKYTNQGQVLQVIVDQYIELFPEILGEDYDPV